MNKAQAQQRADSIRAFREELSRLEEEGLLLLSGGQRERLDRHHEETLAGLARRFDIDTTPKLKQMSVGMRVAAFLGAVALCAAVYFFFYRFWGVLPTALQVVVLIAAPLLGLAATELAARKERTLYIASVLGLVSFACFVVNLQVLGRTFNVTPSKETFLVWGAFALILAYGYCFRLLLVAGILCLLAYVPMTFATWTGNHWFSFGHRPENFFLAGLILLAVPLESRPGRRIDFSAIYRVMGLAVVFVAILILANVGEASYLRLAESTIEALYQAVGFVISALAIFIGIRRTRADVTFTGTVFFTVFLVMEFFEWWWDRMPKYLFFLILGGIAVVVVLVLARFRSLHLRSER